MRHALAILFFLTLTSQLPARNKAVLIGIANYPDTSGWQKLSSRNDIQLLKNTFPPDWEIRILEDEKATRNGIVSLLESIAEHTRPGDTVFIHFSGHGQQMTDTDGDEEDGLDEAFVPVDRDKILVSTFILPHWFLKLLQERGYRLIETDRDDPMLTNNCIALEPGKVVFSAQGVRTRKNLEAAGVEVIPVDISEINRLGGGIHCSTLPLKRDSLTS